MTIGLARHFKVVHPHPRRFLLSKAEVLQWFEAYEAAEVMTGEVDPGGLEWERCYASPQKRASTTASLLFSGEVLYDEALRELNLIPTMRIGWRLPLLAWAILVRLKSGRTNEHTVAFKERVRAFADRLIASGDQHVLVVSHHFVMRELQRDLKRRGYTGDAFRSPEYGKVYVLRR